MNFIVIMSGGAGDRVGAYIPKQYHVVAGKPVIDYVIDACVASQKADKIAIVMDKNWINYSDKIKKVNIRLCITLTYGNTVSE